MLSNRPRYLVRKVSAKGAPPSGNRSDYLAAAALSDGLSIVEIRGLEGKEREVFVHPYRINGLVLRGTCGKGCRTWCDDHDVEYEVEPDLTLN